MGDFEKHSEAWVAKCPVVHWLMAQENGWALEQKMGVLHQCRAVQQKSKKMVMAAVAGVPKAVIDSLISTIVLEKLWTVLTPCPGEMGRLLRALGVLLGLVQEPLASLMMAVVEPALLLVLVSVDVLIGWSSRRGKA